MILGAEIALHLISALRCKNKIKFKTIKKEMREGWPVDELGEGGLNHYSLLMFRGKGKTNKTHTSHYLLFPKNLATTHFTLA